MATHAEVHCLLSSVAYVCLHVQRDAPAASVRGEEAVSRLSAPLGDTEAMAQEVLEASHSIDSLLQRLPDSFSAEEDELKRIEILQVELDTVLREVQGSRELAEHALIEVQEMHASVAGDLLQAKHSKQSA